MAKQDFACSECGANLKYDPGVEALACPYCGASNKVEAQEDEIGEQDYHAVLSQAEAREETYSIEAAKCQSCGAESTLDDNVDTDACPFCGDVLSRSAESKKLIKPQSLLPFQVTLDESRSAFRSWLKGLWFAPNKLKKMQNTAEGMQGVFLPHWTYDADCSSYYTGQRGEYYYVTESYTATDSNGKSVRRTRQKRKTRWYPASGVVGNRFDDLLVVASESLPVKYVEKLEPWGLEDLVGYETEYVAGYRTESYTVDLESGFGQAEVQMKPVVEQAIRRDIGGDTQRIHNYNTNYKSISFKHILLPVWLSCYRYKNVVYRFVVNARTGEVQGERPWSVLKFVALAIGVAAVIGSVVYFSNK